jgi:hypothetical protein
MAETATSQNVLPSLFVMVYVSLVKHRMASNTIGNRTALAMKSDASREKMPRSPHRLIGL